MMVRVAPVYATRRRPPAGRQAFCFEQLRIESTLPDHLHDEGGIPANVLVIGCDIGNRKERDEFAQELVLVGAPVFSNAVIRRRSRK